MLCSWIPLSVWRAITKVKCLVLFATSLEEKTVEMAFSKLRVSKVCVFTVLDYPLLNYSTYFMLTLLYVSNLFFSP